MQVNDFSQLFCDETSPEEASGIINVLAMVHSQEDKKLLLLDIIQALEVPAGQDSEGDCAQGEE